MNLDGLPYRVQAMAVEDVPTVYDIERRVFSMPWAASTFSYELRNNPSSEYLVLRHTPVATAQDNPGLIRRAVHRLLRPSEIDPSLLGYGGFWMMVEEAHICTLAVRPEWRGRGLGELLLLSLIEHAYTRNAQVLTLEVRVSNTVAQRLYAKFGFHQVGRRKAYYSDNREDAYIMTTDPIVSGGYKLRCAELTDALAARLARESQPPLPLGAK